MSLFNEFGRKLRNLFEEEEDGAAPATAEQPGRRPGAGAAASTTAARAEARRRRKLDMRERLAAMIQPDGSVQGGLVKFISLYPIAAAVGDRWPIQFPKAEAMSESVIRRELDDGDLWAGHGDKGFAIIFTGPELTDEEANARCLRIFEAIREHLLGKVPVARPRFSVDPRYLLRALDEDGEPPLVMDDPQEPGVWMPPAAELARRAAYVPPSADPQDMTAAAAPIAAPETSAIAEPPIDWEQMAGRPARPVEVEETRDKRDPTFEAGRSEDRPEGWVDVGRSHDKATPEFEWTYASDDERKAAVAAWDGGYDAPEEFDVGRSRDKRMPELVVMSGESHEQALARYVTMGRFNTMFDAIEVRFRGFWSPRHQAIATWLVDAKLRADDLHADQAVLVERADAVNALAALDIAVLDRTVEAVVPRLEAGAKFFFALPVSFATLLRRTDRHEYFDRWAVLPEAVRRFGRFACYESTGAIGDAPLSEIVGMLTRAGRVPIFAHPNRTADLDRARELRIKAISLDAGGFQDDRAFETATSVAAIAHRHGIMTLFARLPASLRAKALTTEVAMIEGPLAPSADHLPRRPFPLSAAAFVAG